MELEEYLENPDKERLFEEVFTKLVRIQENYSPLITISEDEARIHFENSLKKPDFLGIPISVKDCLCTKGIRTTAGSKILENYVPPFDATSVSKIKKAGYIIGKTAMDEFGFGTFCMNGAYGIPKNPNDIDRCCGGSSGGSACLTKALELPHISIAESTGGSISCPASFCGVYGMTPTYGLVSRYGMIDYASSLDKIGLMGRKIFDIAFGLERIAGTDEREATTLHSGTESYVNCLGMELKEFRIGIPKEYFQGVDNEVKDSVWRTIKKLESLGATYEEISLPLTKYALPAYYILAMSEASTNLAKFCGMRYGMTKEIKGNYNEFFSEVRGEYFGREAKRRILMGTFYRKSGYRDRYYIKALQFRRKIINEFKEKFKKFDCLVAPTMPLIAPKFTEIVMLSPAKQYAMDILTVAPNLCGIPHLSVPCGKSKGMPIGFHIFGDHLQEGKVLQLGSWI